MAEKAKLKAKTNVPLVGGGRVARGETFELADLERAAFFKRLGYVEHIGGAALPAGGDADATEGDPLEGVSFASSAAEDAAREAGLEATDFEGAGPSGEGGYTKADVTSLTEDTE